MGVCCSTQEDWESETTLSKGEFEKITLYFAKGNNAKDNLYRAKIMDIPGEHIKIAPGVVIRLGREGRIGNNVYIGLFSYINGDVVIRDDCTIGPNCVITSNNHVFNPKLQSFKQKNVNKKILIKRGSWVAAGVSITANVTIGECCLICAGAVVTKDVPDYSIVAGIPGKIVGTICPETGEYTWFSRTKSKEAYEIL